jgi:hypothetical protein
MVTDPRPDAPAVSAGETWSETQWVRCNVPMMLLIGALAALSWILFALEVLPERVTGLNLEPSCDAGVIWFLAGVASPVLFWHMRLIVEVSPEALVIRYVPLVRRTIPLAEIESVQVRAYPSYQHYFGSIVRFSVLKHKIYGLNSAQCVRLDLKGGLAVTVGSRCAEGLAAVILEHQRAR